MHQLHHKRPAQNSEECFVRPSIMLSKTRSCKLFGVTKPLLKRKDVETAEVYGDIRERLRLTRNQHNDWTMTTSDQLDFSSIKKPMIRLFSIIKD